MIWTSHRDPVQRSVFRCVLTAGTRSRCRVLPGSTHRLKCRASFINGHLLLHCSRLAVYIHGPDGKGLIKALFDLFIK
ncbi:unnamed protein product, partial [Staurois parvus]